MQRLDQGNLAAETREGLRQLATNRSRADHGDTSGQLGKRENGFVSQVAGFLQSGNGQIRRSGSRRNNGPIEIPISCRRLQSRLG